MWRWAAARRGVLLALLAARRGRPVPVDRIVEALWPDGRPGPPAARGRDAGQPAAGQRSGRTPCRRRRDGYRLGRPPASTSTWTRRRAWSRSARARAGPASWPPRPGARRWTCSATARCWPASRRRTGCSTARRARRAAARRPAGDRAGAAGRRATRSPPRSSPSAAIRTDRLDEAAHRLLMAAHQAAGEPARALTVYERLRAALADELGVDPAPQTREVHLAVLRRGGAAADDAGCPAPDRRARAGRPVRGGRGRLTGPGRRPRAGAVGLLLVAGEGGIGKTRLAAELADRGRGPPAGGCSERAATPSERSLFLQPLVDALAAPLAALPAGAAAGARRARARRRWSGLFPELAGAIGPGRGRARRPGGRAPAGLRGGGRGAARAGRRGARPCCCSTTCTTPAWPPSSCCTTWPGTPGGARLLVLATVRRRGGCGARSTRWPTSPTGSTSARCPPTRCAGWPPTPAGAELAATILRRTRGHTLFVVETLRGLAAGEAGVPESLQAGGAGPAAAARAGRPRSCCGPVRCSGAAVDPAMVAAMLGRPAVRRRPAVRAGRRGRRLLVAAGRQLRVRQRPGPGGALRHHAGAGPDRAPPARRRPARRAGPRRSRRTPRRPQDWPRAARAFLLAGEQALQRFAAADAEALLAPALDAAEQAGEAGAAWAAASWPGAAPGEVLGAFRGALERPPSAALVTARQAGDRRLEMLLLRELGGHAPSRSGCRWPSAPAGCTRGLAIAESLGDRATEAALLGRLAVLASNRLRFGEALGWPGARSPPAGRPAPTGRWPTGWTALKNAYAYLGEPEPLRRVLDELRPLLRRLGDLELPAVGGVRVGLPRDRRRRTGRRREQRIGDAIDDQPPRAGTSATPVAGSSPTWAGWPACRAGWTRRCGTGGDAVELVPAGGQVVVRPGDPEPAGRHAAGARRPPRRRASCSRRRRGDAGRDGAEAYRLRCLAPLAEVDGSTAAVLAEADALLAGISAPPGGGLAARAPTPTCRSPAPGCASATGPRPGRARPAARRRAAAGLGAGAGHGRAGRRHRGGRPGRAVARRAALGAVAELAQRHDMPRVAAARHALLQPACDRAETPGGTVSIRRAIAAGCSSTRRRRRPGGGDRHGRGQRQADGVRGQRRGRPGRHAGGRRAS